MRTRIPSFLIAVFFMGATPAVAQLPPEILADSYLLEVEQAFRDGDYTRAWAKIQEILRLQSDHNLNLPELDFWQAKAADSLGLARAGARICLEVSDNLGTSGPILFRGPDVDEQGAGSSEVQGVGDGRILQEDDARRGLLLSRYRR